MNESSGLEIQYRWNGSETRVVLYSKGRLVLLACCAVTGVLGVGFQMGRISQQNLLPLQVSVPQHEAARQVSPAAPSAPVVPVVPVVPAAQAAMPVQPKAPSLSSESQNPSPSKLSITRFKTTTSEGSIQVSLDLVNLTKKVLSGSITISSGNSVSNAVSFSMKNAVTKTLVLSSSTITANLTAEIPVLVTIVNKNGDVVHKETLRIDSKSAHQSQGTSTEHFAARSHE